MDTVVLDGKKYIKAAKAADEAGYTADYVGQLCRKDKLDAVVIGKTWYVREGELAAHKAGNVRANTEITKRNIEKQREEIVTKPTPSIPMPAYRKRLMETAIQYTAETDELLPFSDSAEKTDSAEKELVSTEEPLESFVSVTNDDVAGNPEIDTESVDTAETISIRKLEQEPEVRHTQKSAITRPAVVARAVSATHISAPEKKAIVRRSDVTREHAMTTPQPQAVVVRRPFLPMAIALTALILVIANLVLQSRWSYSNEVGQQVRIDTGYNVASLQSIIESMQAVQE